MMTRKHFQAIAEIIENTQPGDTMPRAQWDQWEIMARALTRYLSTQNPNFNQTRFELTAGMTQAGVTTR